ncbi:MAG: hypothetical protein ACJA1A_002358 [Saprospiraceae bacterium]|jgi:hypothetical protein
MKVQMMNIKLITAILFCLPIFGLGQMDRYQYVRPITKLIDSAQWQRIDLPSDIYNKTKKNLSDIRIYQVLSDTDTMEWPYILDAFINKSKSKEVKFQLLNQSKRSLGQSFTFYMKNKEIINAVFLDLGNSNFDWKVALEGSTNQKSWSTILDDYRILAIKGPNSDYRYTTLHLPKSNFEYYRLTIKTKDEVKLRKATLSYEEVEENRYHEVSIKTQTISIDKKKKETTIDLHLDQWHQVDQILLKVNDREEYYRHIIIQVVHDSTLIDKKWKYHYRSIYSGTLSSLQRSPFNINDGFGKVFRIGIKNHDNPVLDIASVTLNNRIRSIYSKPSTEDQLFLCYGNNGALAPNYDLKYFKDDIDPNSTSVSLGKESSRSFIKNNKIKPLFDNKWWLWILLVPLVVGLGWTSLRMLKEK